MKVRKLWLGILPALLVSGCIQSHRPEVVHYQPSVVPPPTSDRPEVRVYPAASGSAGQSGSSAPAVSSTDVAIAEAVSQLLHTDPSLSDASQNVLATVYLGVVTLKGNVPSEHARNEMVLRIEKLPGIEQVDDQLRVNIP
ncbi:MAG TPA: BON domain-containing protein [Clostridia bacterium]|nr:BON domain-containing protein [Clostridia bacterium]